MREKNNVELMGLRTFTGEALRDPQTTASVVPSSRYLTRAMIAPLPLEQGGTVVEFGPGTGTITAALLERLPESATLLSFEVNPRFCNYLAERFSDPRLEVVPTSAEHAGRELTARGVSSVAAAVSSLGFSLMDETLRSAILAGIVPFLHPGSVFTQYQYLHGLLAPHLPGNQRSSLESVLRQKFSSVTSEVIWRNVPPALVFTCHP